MRARSRDAQHSVAVMHSVPVMHSVTVPRARTQGAGERRAQPLEHQRVLALESRIPPLLVLPLPRACPCACCSGWHRVGTPQT